MPAKQLTPAEEHQLKIARKTLKMPGAMVGAMGGMTKEEARDIIEKLTGVRPKESKLQREIRAVLVRRRAPEQANAWGIAVRKLMDKSRGVSDSMQVIDGQLSTLRQQFRNISGTQMSFKRTDIPASAKRQALEYEQAINTALDHLGKAIDAMP